MEFRKSKAMVAPVKAVQRDDEILPVSIRMEDIRGRFVIRVIRPVSPRNLVWKLTNCSKATGGLPSMAV